MCTLPAELILKILHESDPEDIVRWKTVSRWFRTITCDDLLWRTLYIDSHLPRPPGPSSFQSRSYVERMLVKSAQLAKSWTTRPMREVSSVKINLGLPLATTPTKLISGRWLVGCEEAKRFVLHDADPRAKTHAHKVLWEQDEPIVSAWDVHSVSPVAGQSIVYVLLELPEIEQPDGSLKWKLLEFRLIDESGEIYDTATIEPPPWAWNSLFEAELHGGKSRFLFIPTEDPMGVVFDTRTRVFYALPSEDTFPVRVEFTDTHIISLYHFYDWIRGPVTLIRISAIPSDVSSVQEGKHILCLTHDDVRIMMPCVDPLTGATSIRLLDYNRFRKITCIDLILPKPSGSKVTRMTIHDGPVIHVREECTAHSPYVDVWGHTQLRGFYRIIPNQHSIDPMENQHVMKFTADMRQDPCAVSCSQMAPAEWSEAADPKVDMTGTEIRFDGLRERLCYVHPQVEHEIVVVEIE